MKTIGSLLLVMVAVSAAWAGPYSGAQSDPGNPYDPGIAGFVDSQVNEVFVAWADGYVNYLPAPGVATGWQTPAKALGEVTGNTTDIVSLGDLNSAQIAAGVAPGEITLTFDSPIANGGGADFAVFENGFISAGGSGVEGEIFGELGYVEVSSNGTDFARFPCVSLTPDLVGGYGTIDPTNVYNLCGKHVNNDSSGGTQYEGSFGTPFDLDDLAGHELIIAGLLDLYDINYVRIIDVPGSGDFLDGNGGPIYDPWVTWGSGGVDLEAVGVIHLQPIDGDLNGDGIVGGGDLNIVLGAWGLDVARGDWLAGDPSGDGFVGGGDLNIVLGAWGNSKPPTLTVPEPASIFMLLGGVIMLLHRAARCNLRWSHN